MIESHAHEILLHDVIGTPGTDRAPERSVGLFIKSRILGVHPETALALAACPVEIRDRAARVFMRRTAAA